MPATSRSLSNPDALSNNTNLSRVLQCLTAFKMTLDKVFPQQNSVELLVRGIIRPDGTLAGLAEKFEIPHDSQGNLILDITQESEFDKWLVIIGELQQQLTDYQKLHSKKHLIKDWK